MGILAKNEDLKARKRFLADIVQRLRFGVVERLAIRAGVPCYEPQPHVVQVIKLDSDLAELQDPLPSTLPLKKEFDNLFEQLSRLPDGFVDIEVRHSLPFRLTVEWPPPSGIDSEEIR